jgi:hypothetical protein
MQRPGLPKALLAATTRSVSLDRSSQAQTSSPACFALTEAERAPDVTPVSYQLSRVTGVGMMRHRCEVEGDERVLTEAQVAADATRASTT